MKERGAQDMLHAILIVACVSVEVAVAVAVAIAIVIFGCCCRFPFRLQYAYIRVYSKIVNWSSIAFEANPVLIPVDSRLLKIESHCL